MRDETTMMNLLLAFAEEHELVRGAYLNGSRTNPTVVKDAYQDYDIVYLVNDLDPFLTDKTWLNYFGEIAIKQEPDALDEMSSQESASTVADGFYMFLVLFTDGNRLDIKLLQTEFREEHLEEDRLIIPLLDKDELLVKVPHISSDMTHWIQKPTAGDYFAVCNDFWWCLQNVAKGLARKEITYAQAMYETVVRPGFNQVLFWRIAAEYEFQISLGKDGKFLPRYLSEEAWQAYLKTYANGEVPELERSMLLMMELFSHEAQQVATLFNFKYQAEDEKAIRNYIQQLKIIASDNDNNIM